MTDMSPLRRRMIEDMKVRNLSPRTQRCYVHAVAKFARHFKRSPDRLGLADLRDYQIHLVSTGASWASLTSRSAPCASFTASRSGAARSWTASPTRASDGSCP